VQSGCQLGALFKRELFNRSFDFSHAHSVQKCSDGCSKP
jgi:hypothetical protein